MIIKKSKAILNLVNSIGPPWIGLQFITFATNSELSDYKSDTNQNILRKFLQRFIIISLTRPVQAWWKLVFGSSRFVKIFQILTSFNWSSIWKFSSVLAGSAKERDIIRKQNRIFFWISGVSPSCIWMRTNCCDFHFLNSISFLNMNNVTSKIYKPDASA